MCLKEAFADRRFYAGIEYKINKFRGEYKLFIAQKPEVLAGFSGPDSWLSTPAKIIS